eukprot:TRINITY_DN31477_c0_g1_i1.p1 TRINITY_DN31477_c0_g1~~TRINITY_DN31477_c0_g1_i1.p1  ORF type:complete len:409 (-),score=96.28 TRINITY_DN31477_c0_g1_i1:41-1267(-)
MTMRRNIGGLALAAIVAAGYRDAGGWAGPRVYNARRVASGPITIDGDIYKPVWEEVPWSEDFVDIQGADAPEGSGPFAGTRTRMKMRWDDEYLYIATEMSADNWPIIAEFTKRNDPIFQKDSDIEVFIDADGSHHHYKELEVSAKNTVWNLMLDKPYSSGGSEHSGRVAKPGDPQYWDVKKQKTATKMYGELGKANPGGKWTAEMALSHRDTLSKLSDSQASKPTAGRFWRINFSRVERKGKYNWVWSPQMLWDPSKTRFAGEISMHAPEAWGYVHFVEADDTKSSWTDPHWPLKAAAAQLFHAEQYALAHDGGSALSLEDLRSKGYIEDEAFEALKVNIQSGSKEWTASLQDASDCVAQLRWDDNLNFRCVPVSGRVVTAAKRAEQRERGDLRGSTARDGAGNIGSG